MIFSKTLPGGAYHRAGPINARFEKTFLAHAVPERSLLLIQDGASSHMNAPLIRKAVANDVVLLCPPPHSTT